MHNNFKAASNDAHDTQLEKGEGDGGGGGGEKRYATVRSELIKSFAQPSCNNAASSRNCVANKCA